MRITEEQLGAFAGVLRRAERSPGTVENYLRHARAFARWLGEAPPSPERAAQWKGVLLDRGHRPATVNGMLVAVNQFFKFLGRDDCRVRALRVQRPLFREERRELTREEYTRLLAAAGKLGRERLALLMEAICATGIRVSELKYLTVEAARTGRAEIHLKGKVRTILIPGRLGRKLARYAQKRGITAGEVFRTRGGRPLSRKQIWAEMKSLCQKAGVAATKVFPHNLRHLVARAFYKACRDVAKLADVLGHSCLETTRIYLISTGAEHARQLERLNLIL